MNGNRRHSCCQPVINDMTISIGQQSNRKRNNIGRPFNQFGHADLFYFHWCPLVCRSFPLVGTIHWLMECALYRSKKVLTLNEHDSKVTSNRREAFYMLVGDWGRLQYENARMFVLGV